MWYRQGNITLTAGSRAVTATGTAFIANVKESDTLLRNGASGVVESVDSNQALTLREPWGGTSYTGPTYDILHTGSGWHSTVVVNELVVELIRKIESGLPLHPDATGTLAQRAAFDSRVPPFLYLRTDVNPFLMYAKLSAALGDWSTGQSIQGPTGLQGPTGDTGATGATGPATTITIGTVTEGAANATMSGFAPNQTLNLTLPRGYKGWTPQLAVVTDGTRRVLQVVGWTGGEGTAPTSGLYVGATGLVALIANAVDIRGAEGAGVSTITSTDISHTPAGTISSTNVGAALNELGTEKAALAGATFTGAVFVPTPAAGANSTEAANASWVLARIAALVASAPGTLDTLNELAAALGNDPNFATTITNALAGKAATVHTHAAADVTSGIFAIGRIPTAPSGTSNTTTVVRADDARLSDARAPTAHTHTIADIPVAASGVVDTTKVVRADDARLSNSRTPLAHTHPQSDVTNLTTDLAAKANLTGGTFTGGIAVRSVSNFGIVGLTPGTITQAGYVYWSQPSGTRIGYMGWDASNVSITCEVGGFVVNGATAVTFNVRPTWASLTPWDNGNFTPTAQPASNITSGTFADARMPGRIQRLAGLTNDWNSTLDNGYWYSLNNLSGNAPYNSAWQGLVSSYGDDSYKTQIVWDLSLNDNTDTKTYRREMNGGVWTAWEKIIQTKGELAARFVFSRSDRGRRLFGERIRDCHADLNFTCGWYGDSIIWGYNQVGAQSSYNAPTSLGAAMALIYTVASVCDNKGISGENISSGLTRFKADVAAGYSPRFVIISYGTNDGNGAFITAAAYRGYLEEWIDLAFSKGIAVVIATPPMPASLAYNRNMAGYVRAAAEVAEEHGIPCIDLQEQIGWFEKRYYDGLHYQDATYKIMGRDLFAVFAPFFGSAEGPPSVGPGTRLEAQWLTQFGGTVVGNSSARNGLALNVSSGASLLVGVNVEADCIPIFHLNNQTSGGTANTLQFNYADGVVPGFPLVNLTHDGHSGVIDRFAGPRLHRGYRFLRLYGASAYSIEAIEFVSGAAAVSMASRWRQSNLRGGLGYAVGGVRSPVKTDVDCQFTAPRRLMFSAKIPTPTGANQIGVGVSCLALAQYDGLGVYNVIMALREGAQDLRIRKYEASVSADFLINGFFPVGDWEGSLEIILTTTTFGVRRDAGAVSTVSTAFTGSDANMRFAPAMMSWGFEPKFFVYGCDVEA